MPAALADLLATLGPGVPAPIRRAIERVPRHHFLAEVFRDEAYKDSALPIGHGLSASRPSVIVRMLSLLGERTSVLEVGTGCGWQTALLSTYCRIVCSVEANPGLHERSLRDLAAYPVRLCLADGMQGWPDFAPYDGIVVCAAVTNVPHALLDQLADDGVVVFPLNEDGRQELCRVTKHGTLERFGASHFTPARA